MPALRNPKWEAAAYAIASGLSQREAYRAGGLKYDGGSASKLFARKEVKARIQEILAEQHEMTRVAAQKSAQEAGTDRAWVIRNLRNVALLGMRGHPLYDRMGKQLLDANGNVRYGKPDLTPAAYALRLIGMDQGMFIQRTEIGGPGDFARMSDAELMQELTLQAESLGIPADAIKLLEHQPTESEEDEDA